MKILALLTGITIMFLSIALPLDPATLHNVDVGTAKFMAFCVGDLIFAGSNRAVMNKEKI